MADASPGQLTRQQLYDRIRETSKDEYILSEMKRLGFWASDTDQPQLSEDLIKRRGELERELRKLMKTQRMLEDPEQALNQFRKERMAEARARREETKQRKARERHERALKWHARQQNEITYLGENISAALHKKQLDIARLRSQGLPVLHNAKGLATSMGVTLNELRFLAYTRKTGKTNHYKRFVIAKKTGGQRHISAPMPRLKRAQYWVLENILLKLPFDDCAHGFVSGRSIISNARPHLGQDVVINLDLKDFFPSINYERIKGLYIKFGYSEEIATILALICSEPEVDEIELDGEIWHLARGTRHMPQGAPTSPAISNLICRRLDKRLKGLAQKFGYTYTRYADDLTFSASGLATNNTGKLIHFVKEIVEGEGFIVHPDKTRIMRKGRRQEVTGLTVNEKLSVDRKTLKRFRSLLFQIEKDGPEGKTWGTGNLLDAIKGYANYVGMVSPEKGGLLKERVANIVERYYPKSSPVRFDRKPLNKKHFRKMAALGQPPRSDWWEPRQTAPPELEQTDQQTREQKREHRREEKQRKQQEQAQSARSEVQSSIAATNTDPVMERESIWSVIFLVGIVLLIFVMLTFG